jgi:hypothetical protein
MADRRAQVTLVSYTSKGVITNSIITHASTTVSLLQLQTGTDNAFDDLTAVVCAV